MKHPPILRLLATLLLALTATVASAYSFEVDGIYYSKNSDGTSVTVTSGNNKYTGSVTIPSQVTYSGTTYSVTSIGYEAFRSCCGLTSVTIPNSVTEIGSHAFYGCNGLSTIEYDSNCYYDFGVQPSGFLNKVRFIYGNSVTTANTQFLHDLQPVSVTIGTNVSSVVGSSYTPTKTIWLTNTPPEGCEKVKGNVNYVSNDKYPENWKTEVYSYLSSWFEVDGVVYVPVVPSERTCDAIDVCHGILPSEVTLGEATFNGITLNVKNVSQYTFSGCDQLTSITLSEGITSLDNYALNGCNKITELTIPSTVNYIGHFAFNQCTSLKKFTISDRNTELLLGSNGSSPLFADCPLSEVYIGGNIAYSTDETDGYSPFYRNTTLKTVIITDEETEISDNEFYGCTKLANVTMGDGVERIGNWAFSGCSSLNQLQFGTGMKTIGDEAFSDCANVTAIYSYTAVPPVCGSQALDDINKWTC
ncbi:MAG: leucine-rich repeat domain-containing protein, partial [Muribaculaceae bacterium]